MNKMQKDALNFIKNDFSLNYKNLINKIYLYGSCARNEEKIMSDIDIMVCINNKVIKNIYDSPKLMRQLRNDAVPNFLCSDIDVHFCNDDIYNEKYDNDLLIKNIRKDAVLIYGK